PFDFGNGRPACPRGAGDQGGQRAEESEGEGGEAPRGASEVQLEDGGIEGELARPGEGESGGGGAEDEGIFVAAVLGEEAFFEVDAPDGDDHRGEDGGGGEGGQQAEGEREIGRAHV